MLLPLLTKAIFTFQKKSHIYLFDRKKQMISRMPLLISSNPLRSHISSPPRLPPPLNLDVQSKYVTPLALSMPPSITIRSTEAHAAALAGHHACVIWGTRSLGNCKVWGTSLRTSCHRKIPVVLIVTMSWCTYACKQLFPVSLRPHAISQSFYSLSFVISHRILAIL